MPAGPEPITATRLPETFRRNQRFYPAHVPAFIDNGALYRFNGDRLIRQVQCTRRFTGRRTNAAGKFGKIVGAVQNRSASCQSPR